jgi:hypothetical protein
MMIVGGLLLLPGICAVLFAQSRISYTIYAAGFVGLILVFWALQRLRRRARIEMLASTWGAVRLAHPQDSQHAADGSDAMSYNTPPPPAGPALIRAGFRQPSR